MLDQPADRVAGLALRNQLRQAAVIASGKPVSPSMRVIRMSCSPRFFSSFITDSQNLALLSG